MYFYNQTEVPTIKEIFFKNLNCQFLQFLSRKIIRFYTTAMWLHFGIIIIIINLIVITIIYSTLLICFVKKIIFTIVTNVLYIVSYLYSTFLFKFTFFTISRSLLTLQLYNFTYFTYISYDNFNIVAFARNQEKLPLFNSFFSLRNR